MERTVKMRKKIKKMRRLRDIDDFIDEQISRYNKINREHEKEITYIG